MYLNDAMLDSGALGRRILADPLVSSSLAGKLATPGAWTSYTPTLVGTTTNPTLGSGATASGYYVQTGKIVHFVAYIKFGTSLNAGAGYYRMSLPVNSVASRGGFPVGHGYAYDDSANARTQIGASVVGTDASLVDMYADRASTFGALSATWPYAWAASDIITITGTYESV